MSATGDKPTTGPVSAGPALAGPTPALPPCVLFEDEDLLVVHKPPGWNTHAPEPFAGEGIYDWLRHREPRWARLAIIHRLDKETSGVLVLGKTARANRELTRQFAERQVEKTYLLLTDRPMPAAELTVRSKIARAGNRFVSSPHGEEAQTRFRVRTLLADRADRQPPQGCGADGEADAARGWPGLGGNARVTLVEARPLTGRTHQIRVHAAQSGFPILGDTLYGGTPWRRVCLHAAELTLRHPTSGERVTFRAPAEFFEEPAAALRRALLESALTDAYRLIHGASDGWPGWYLDRLGEFWLSQSERPLSEARREWLARLVETDSGARAGGGHSAPPFGDAPLGVYHKTLTRRVRDVPAEAASPRLVLGRAAPERFTVRENGVLFELSFREGYSIGLFLDQRENRRRLLTGHVSAGFPLHQAESGPRPPEVLNLFAYTCGLSVCAALGGARTTSVDLSRGYLDWGRRNFLLNRLDPADHEFLQGDTFDWLRRLAKKGRLFDVVLLDPPTFSQSKVGGVFRAEKDYGGLAAAALRVLRPEGVLFASTNAAQWPADRFLATLDAALRAAGRRVVQRHYVPQPPDFPISRTEPAYLKTVWLRVA